MIHFRIEIGGMFDFVLLSMASKAGQPSFTRLSKTGIVSHDWRLFVQFFSSGLSSIIRNLRTILDFDCHHIGNPTAKTKPHHQYVHCNLCAI
jgi:hypothetical protein